MEREPPGADQLAVPSSKPGFCKRLIESSALSTPPGDRTIIIRIARVAICEVFNSKKTFLEDTHILS